MADNLYVFLQGFYALHPELLNRGLYIMGERWVCAIVMMMEGEGWMDGGTDGRPTQTMCGKVYGVWNGHRNNDDAFAHHSITYNEEGECVYVMNKFHRQTQ